MGNKIALITGATSGFGEAIARRFANEGYHIIITGRRQDRLNKLLSELKDSSGLNVIALNFDVQNQKEVHDAISSLDAKWKNIDVLVNNAGLAVGKEPFQDGLIDDWERMLNTNVKGLIYVTKAVVEHMIARKNGHIINIGSIAGKEVYPGGNVYSASKFAVDGLSKSMRIDFLPHNIKVSQINPGAAETEFSIVRFKGDTHKAENVYQGFVPLNALDIADAAWYIVSRPAHVCINDMVIMPAAQAGALHIHKSNISKA